MLDKRIIYQNDTGGVAIIIPCDNVTVPLTEEEHAAFTIETDSFVDRAASVQDEDYDDFYRDRAELEQRIQARIAHVMTVEEIAAKDVPIGKPYKIVDVADIPTDRQLRDAWTVDEADLTDGVGA
jgi:hypothetical protein